MGDGWMNLLSAVTGGLIAGAASLLVAKVMMKEQRFDRASDKFRSAVFDELKGVYPAPYNLTDDEIKKLRTAKSTIVSAIAEFTPYVKDKRGFKRAGNHFKNLCTAPPKLDSCELSKIDKQSAELRIKKGRNRINRTVDNLLTFSEPRSCIDYSQDIWNRFNEMLKKIPKLHSQSHENNPN